MMVGVERVVFVTISVLVYANTTSHIHAIRRDGGV